MILDEIAGYARERVRGLKRLKSLEIVREEAEARPAGKNFYEALAKPGLSVIAELKKASPSKGLIAPEFEKIYLQRAAAYELGGAAAISCLTEPKFFLGSDQYLSNVRKVVSIPILRKDFTVDEYQIYEAKNIGADAVLLICSILSEVQLKEYLDLARSLGLSALVEAHTAEETGMALNAGARIIGVNNRNLKDFSVNPLNSLRLRDNIPKDRIFVAESGIQKVADVFGLKKAGVNAVLIGEALMRTNNPAAMIGEILGE